VGTRNGSVVRRRQLARQLRLLREDVGLTLESAAPALDWSVSKLSRIETAQQAVDAHGVRSMLDLYEVGGDRWTQIITLCRASRRKGWWRAYGLGDDSYVGFKTEATLVQDLTVSSIPGPPQTEAYSRALFEAVPIRRSAQEIDAAASVRAIRQERLTSADDPLGLVAIIDEPALHRIVGDRAAHSRQLDHLVAAAAWPAVTLQVLPASVGAYGAIASGFTILSFGSLGEPDMAYVEHALGALNVEKEADVARAKLLFDRLRSDALSPPDSTALNEQVARST
jgi:Domain of unknown function (DUF5753)/Helix-turn-helix domain